MTRAVARLLGHLELRGAAGQQARDARVAQRFPGGRGRARVRVRVPGCQAAVASHVGCVSGSRS